MLLFLVQINAPEIKAPNIDPKTRAVNELEIYGLDGQKFLSSIELSQKAQRLAEYIRSLGIDPDTL